MGSLIVLHIFSVTSELSSDISHREQLALCLCFHFLGVVHVDNTTSLSLKKEIEDLLSPSAYYIHWFAHQLQLMQDLIILVGDPTTKLGHVIRTCCRGHKKQDKLGNLMQELRQKRRVI
ncbi:hypothetical protein ACJX0J_020465 [Zea mays]